MHCSDCVVDTIEKVPFNVATSRKQRSRFGYTRTLGTESDFETVQNTKESAKSTGEFC